MHRPNPNLQVGNTAYVPLEDLLYKGHRCHTFRKVPSNALTRPFFILLRRQIGTGKCRSHCCWGIGTNTSRARTVTNITVKLRRRIFYVSFGK